MGIGRGVERGVREREDEPDQKHITYMYNIVEEQINKKLWKKTKACQKVGIKK